MNIDAIFYGVGVGTTVFLSWLLIFRHIIHGLKEAISASIHIAKLDFASTDPDEVNVEVAKHFNNWDKLWLVPRHFRNVLFRETMKHWKYH